MPSTFLGEIGCGGGGASSVFLFGMEYGPMSPPGPPASAGASCLGLPLSLPCGAVRDWSWADAGMTLESNDSETTVASIHVARSSQLERRFLVRKLANICKPRRCK